MVILCPGYGPVRTTEKAGLDSRAEVALKCIDLPLVAAATQPSPKQIPTGTRISAIGKSSQQRPLMSRAGPHEVSLVDLILVPKHSLIFYMVLAHPTFPTRCFRGTRRVIVRMGAGAVGSWIHWAGRFMANPNPSGVTYIESTTVIWTRQRPSPDASAPRYHFCTRSLPHSPCHAVVILRILREMKRRMLALRELADVSSDLVADLSWNFQCPIPISARNIAEECTQRGSIISGGRIRYVGHLLILVKLDSIRSRCPRSWPVGTSRACTITVFCVRFYFMVPGTRPSQRVVATSTPCRR